MPPTVNVTGNTNEKAAVNTNPGEIIITATGQAPNESYSIKVYQGDSTTALRSDTGSTDANGNGKVTFEHLAAGDYRVELTRVLTGNSDTTLVTVPAPPA